jgi:hypothetical protein
MKNILGIIVLGLLLSGCATAPTVNDLVGKKILCGEWSTDNKVLITKLPIDAYDFVTENSVTYYTISETSDPRIGYSNSTDVICRPLNDKKNIRKMFNKIHKLRLEKLKF